MSNKLLCLLTLVLCMCIMPEVTVGAPASIKPKAKLKAAVQPILTQQQVQAYIDEVKPLVEQAAGRKFKNPLRFKLVSRQQLYDSEVHESLQRYKLSTDLPEEDKRRDLMGEKFWASIYSLRAIGLYSTDMQVLFIVPSNFTARMKAGKFTKDEQMPAFKLVLAHELAHALNDQNIGISRIQNRAVTVDENSAVMATIEGFAVFIMDRVAEKMNRAGINKKMNESISVKVPEIVDLVGDEQADYLSRMNELIYLKGRDFISWQEAGGGNERVWQILANPPLRTSVIFNPETYSAQNSRIPSYASVTKGLEMMFAKRKWTVEHAQMGEFGIRLLYADLKPAALEKIAAGVECTEMMNASDGSVSAGISVNVLKDASVTPALMSASEKKCREYAKSYDDNYRFKLSQLKTSTYPELKLDSGNRMDYIMHSEDESYRGSMIQLSRGNYLINIYAVNIKLTDKQISKIAGEVFSRLARMQD